MPDSEVAAPDIQGEQDPGDVPRAGGAGAPWLVALALLAAGYLLPAFLRPLFIPDEPRYGEIAREMVATGDWIVPRLDGVRYFEKPPLQYWATGLAQLTFGKSVFAVRFAGLLSVAIVGLLLVRAARRTGLGMEAGRWAALVWASSLLVFVIGTLGIIDALLSMLLTACLLALQAWMAAEDRAAARRWLALCGAAAGLAFLAKGFMAFAVPGVVAAIVLTWERRWTDFLRDIWLPLLAALAVVLPWAVAMALREGDFWRYFWIVAHVRRFTGEDAQHTEPVWFYVPVVLGGLLPWSFFLPSVWGGLRGRGEGALRPASERLFLRFLLVWVVAVLGFFSASRGKLPTYMLPLFPPLALVVGLGLVRSLGAGRRKAFDRGAYAVAMLFGVVALAVPLVQVLASRPPFGPEHTSHAVALGVGFLLWAVAALLSARALEPRRKLAWLALGPVGVMLASSFALPTSTLEKKAPGALLGEARQLILPGDLIVSDANLIHAVTWTLERQDVYALGERGELTYGLTYPDAEGRALEAEGVRALMARRGPGQAVFVFRKSYQEPRDGEFGAEATLELERGMFLAQEFRAPGPVGTDPSGM